MKTLNPCIERGKERQTSNPCIERGNERQTLKTQPMPNMYHMKNINSQCGTWWMNQKSTMKMLRVKIFLMPFESVLKLDFFFLHVLGVKRFTQFLITKHKLLPEKRQWEKKTTQKQSRESVIKLSKKNDFIASTISWNEAKILLKYLHIMRPSWNSNWCKINNNVVISVSEPFS